MIEMNRNAIAMKQCRLAGSLLALSLGFPGLAEAGNNVNITFPPSSFDDPRDSATLWVPIASAEHTDGSICNPSDILNTLDDVRMDDNGRTAIGSMVFDGLTHSVYPTDVPGIGWIYSTRVTAVTDGNNDVHPGDPTVKALTDTGEIQLYPFPGFGDPIEAFDAYGKMTFVKTVGQIPPGSYTVAVPNQSQLATYRCLRRIGIGSGVADEGFATLTAPVTINVAAAGCVLESPANEELPFGTFGVSQFPSVGSTSETKTVPVRLQCDPNINLKFTITDQSNPANRTDQITLTPQSTAQGLAVQAVDMFNGQGVYRMGPDASAAGVENQYPIINTGPGGAVDFPIGFYYIRTGALSAGSANARVTLTFSYQ